MQADRPTIAMMTSWCFFNLREFVIFFVFDQYYCQIVMEKGNAALIVHQLLGSKL